MPLVFRDGTKIGPVSLICATACFAISVGAFVYLVHLEPGQIDGYLRPLVPAFVNIATALFIWVRVHQVSQNVDSTQTKVEQTQDKLAQTNANVIATNKALNGDLEKRINNAVETGVNNALNPTPPPVIKEADTTIGDPPEGKT